MILAGIILYIVLALAIAFCMHVDDYVKGSTDMRLAEYLLVGVFFGWLIALLFPLALLEQLPWGKAGGFLCSPVTWLHRKLQRRLDVAGCGHVPADSAATEHDVLTVCPACKKAWRACDFCYRRYGAMQVFAADRWLKHHACPACKETK